LASKAGALLPELVEAATRSGRPDDAADAVGAREQMRLAHQLPTAMGARAFAERARRELEAAGESVRRLTAETRDLLTPQATQLARMAADCLTNPEIGAQLFISPRPVEYQLRKVFDKLSISSRRELSGALS
jgi:DNA-binding NarL/FixJ family response regulator